MGNQQSSAARKLLAQLPDGKCRISASTASTVTVIPLFTVADVNNQLQLLRRTPETVSGESSYDQSLIPFYFEFVDGQQVQSSICSQLSCFFTNIFTLTHLPDEKTLVTCVSANKTTFYGSLSSALGANDKPKQNINVFTHSTSYASLAAGSLTPPEAKEEESVRERAAEDVGRKMIRLLNVTTLDKGQGQLLVFLTLRMQSLHEFDLFMAVIAMLHAPEESKKQLSKIFNQVSPIACVKDDANLLEKVIQVTKNQVDSITLKQAFKSTQNSFLPGWVLMHASDLWQQSSRGDPHNPQLVYHKFLASSVLRAQLVWHNYLVQQQLSVEMMPEIVRFTLPPEFVSTADLALFRETISKDAERKNLEAAVKTLTKNATFWQKVGSKKTQLALGTLAAGAAAALAGLGIAKRETIKSGFQKFVKAIRNKVGFVSNKTSDIDGLLVQIDALVEDLNCPEKEKEKIRHLVRTSRNQLSQASKVNSSLSQDIPAGGGSLF